MSRYIMIRRLRGPAFLLLVGALALLNQADILSWGKSWPLFLILAGVLALAERAALAAEGGYPPVPYPGAPYPGQPFPGAGSTQNTAQTGVSIVPANSDYYGKGSEGGQS
jgi:hypothetical protein